MGLTLERLHRLERVGLVHFYNENEAAFKTSAKEAYDYIEKGFDGERVRPDDVIDSLLSVIEINKELRTFLNAKKLTQKYYLTDFVDLILDRTWDEIADGD